MGEYFVQPRIPEGTIHLIIGDKDPGPLASGNLEFLGRSDAPDVGVPAGARDGEYIHSNVDYGNQRRV